MNRWKPVIRATALTVGGGAGFLVLGLLGVLAASRAGWIEALPGELAVTGVYAVGMMAGAMWVGAAWMRSIDEAAREAHKSAWFWGGLAGMSVGGFAIILSLLPQASSWRLPFTFFGREDPAIHAAIGAYAMQLLMVLGYTVAWAWWWWKRR